MLKSQPMQHTEALFHNILIKSGRIIYNNCSHIVHEKLLKLKESQALINTVELYEAIKSVEGKCS